jgi:Uma2 family endonuclease
MATVSSTSSPLSPELRPLAASQTLADVVRRLGDIPLERIRVVPPLGTATEKDVVEADERFNQHCELIDGVLVEKAVGYLESAVAMLIGRLLGDFVEKHGLGVVAGEGGMMRVLPGQVRIPDISFVAWSRFPEGRLPREPIPAVAPDLAVEVLSKSNTPGEMERKLRDYFQAGVRLVWYIDAETRTATVYAGPDQGRTIRGEELLDGGEVLPGFQVSLAEVFARAERQPNVGT